MICILFHKHSQRKRRSGMNEEQVNRLLELLDEFIGSWHRLVDSIERISNKDD